MQYSKKVGIMRRKDQKCGPKIFWGTESFGTPRSRFDKVQKKQKNLNKKFFSSDSMKNVVGQKSEVQRERSATMPMEFL